METQQQGLLDIETMALLMSFSETMRELISSSTPQQFAHLMWLREVMDKLEVKLRK